MTQDGAADASAGPLNAIVSFAIFAAVVVITYRSERAYRRWSAEHHPFAAHKVRIARMKTGYRESRSTATEVAQLAGGLMDEVNRARS